MISRALFWFVFLYFSVVCVASEPIILTDREDGLVFKGKYVDYLEDPGNTLTFSQISSQAFADKYVHTPNFNVEKNIHTGSTYWLRMEVINHAGPEAHFVSELYDFRLDYYEYYVVKNGKVVLHKSGGDNYPFYHKQFAHKNFIHQLPVGPGEQVTIYYKIKSDEPVSFIGSIRSFERLLGYSNNEYFLLAIFYGMILSMMLYNFFGFIAVKDVSYLYYILYAFSVGVYSLSQDGLGFQYLWYDHPSLNLDIYHISSFFIIFWVVLYSVSFLQSQHIFPPVYKVTACLLAGRFILFLISLRIPVVTQWFDLIIMLVMYILGVVSWRGGNRMARFYVIGFSIFLLGYLMTFLLISSYIRSIPHIIYSFNIGILCEMFMFSFALADRFKIINEQNIENQKKLLAQAEEQEMRIKQANKELEEKVRERTKSLEQKNKEMDLFVYKSSHDIKGPLKSILGLSMYGLKEVKEPIAQQFLSRILDSSRKLDKVNDGLLSIIDFRNKEVNVEEVGFESMLSEILVPLRENPKFDFIQKEVKVEQDAPFFSDVQTIHIVLKDILETSALLADPAHAVSFMKVQVTVKEGRAKIYISVTGKGVSQEVIDQMYNPFSIHYSLQGTNALGLYLLRMYIEKIQGVLKFSSTLGQGGQFDIELPDLLQQ